MWGCLCSDLAAGGVERLTNRARLGLLAAFPLLAAAAPLVAFVSIEQSAFDTLFRMPTNHFIIVSAASMLAGLFAILVGLAAKAQRNVQVTFLSTAFISLAFFFTLHGLSTPGFLLAPSPVPTIAAQLSVAVTSVWLFLSSLSSDSFVVRRVGRSQGGLTTWWTGLMLLVVALGLYRPDLWSAIPVDTPPLVWIVTVITIALLIIASMRYWRSFVYSRMPLPYAIVFAALWLAGAQWIMTQAELWRLSWWIYHFLLVFAVAALLVGVFYQYVRGASFQESVRGLLLADPIDRLDVGLSPSVQALVMATEARDLYTAGHSYRVAVTAVRIGQALHLSADELRALAIGGLMHDVGKIEVPDQILNKPGRLTSQERRTIEQHPQSGYRLCRSVGIMAKELEIIRYHHERWDGGGYPCGLRGADIPKLARVLAVADVYDALTSSRSYRAAFTHERAYQMVCAESGAAFDPEVVAVWAQLTKEGPVVASNVGPPWSPSTNASGGVSDEAHDHDRSRGSGRRRAL